MGRLIRLAGALALASSLGTGSAHANGAFPDSLRIFVPVDRPAEIVLATNFGLVMSRDDGATWDWVCEHGEGNMATLYQMAAPPSRRLLAVAPGGVARSDDDACTWSLAADLTATTVTDVFADPVNPARVLALAGFIDPGGQPRSGLYVSGNAGQTFGAATYLAPLGSQLLSVEVAASKPDRIYLTTVRADPSGTGGSVMRSDDAGGTWTINDVTATTGARLVRIAAIDPSDAQKVYFRVTGGDEDAIAITTDGAMTLTLPLVVTSQLTGFLRRSNGQLLVSALDLVDGALYRSVDGGKSFTRMATRLAIRALAERAGKLYVAADNVIDGFALGVSTDDGETFRPLLRFDQVKGARACGQVAAACAASCANLETLGTFAPAACGHGDAGTEGGVTPPKPPASGCGCHLRHPSSSPGVAALLALVLVSALARRRR